MWGGRRKKVGEREKRVWERWWSRLRLGPEPPPAAEHGEGCGRRRGAPPESPTRAARGEGGATESNEPRDTLLLLLCHRMEMCLIDLQNHEHFQRLMHRGQSSVCLISMPIYIYYVDGIH